MTNEFELLYRTLRFCAQSSVTNIRASKGRNTRIWELNPIYFTSRDSQDCHQLSSLRSINRVVRHYSSRNVSLWHRSVIGFCGAVASFSDVDHDRVRRARSEFARPRSIFTKLTRWMSPCCLSVIKLKFYRNNLLPRSLSFSLVCQ